MNKDSYTFELRVRPKEEGDYALELWELPPGDSQAKPYRRGRKLSQIGGWHLRMVQGTIHRALDAAGYKPILLKRTRRAPFRMDEEIGVHLDLAFRAINGLSKRSRLEEILFGLNAMEREEAFYWHAKVMHDNGTTATNGLKALRTLLGGS